jgi:hypothetical protein
VPGRQHQDGQLGVAGSQDPARRQTVHVGHHHVQDHEVGELVGARIHGFDAGADGGHLEPFEPQGAFERLTDGAVVLRDEDAAPGDGHCPSVRRLSPSLGPGSGLLRSSRERLPVDLQRSGIVAVVPNAHVHSNKEIP